jgi:hypothetical protein
MAKVENSVSIEQGEFIRLNKNLLTVEPDYQRQASAKLIKDISREWDSSAVGAITVNVRNNTYYVIDGQHRVEAAKTRPEVTHLPCIVFTGKTKAEEAGILRKMNSNVKIMTSIDKFRASVEEGDELAKWVNNRFKAAGYEVAAKGLRVVRGIRPIMNVAAESKTKFDRVLTLCVKLCKHEPITSTLFSGLSVIDSKMNGLEPRLQDRLIDIGIRQIMESIKREQISSGNKHSLTLARGIMNAANKAMKNRFEFES